MWSTHLTLSKHRDPLEFLESYTTLKRCLDSLCADLYGETEFTATQARFLRHIAANPGISQAELARATCADAALTGRALQPLLDRGCVKRERSAKDRREYVLSLGAPGRPALKRVEQVRMKLAATLVERLDASDLESFDRIVDKLNASVDSPLPSSNASNGNASKPNASNANASIKTIAASDEPRKKRVNARRTHR